jgi:hypothetical protein
MVQRKDKPRKLVLDATAASATPGQAAFLSRPRGAPAYHGFPVIEETRTSDGWVFGAITAFMDPDGCDAGDGFVEAPDGSRAGLVWEVGNGESATILPPDEERWGVYAVSFPRAVRDLEDLSANFRAVLPFLREQFRTVRANRMPNEEL